MNKKPVLVASSCLTGERVRYDGQNAADHFVIKLSKYVSIIKVCPEVEIGLGIPRKKVFLVKKNSYALFQEKTGKELTQQLNRFSKKFLSSLKCVDGFLLKSKSPSCGVYHGAKTYKNADRTGYLGRKRGLFAQAVKESFPFHPVEDEKRLKDFHIRFLFLTKLYLFFYFREYGADYVLEKYPEQLKLFSNTGFKKFKKYRDSTTFLNIFRGNIGRKTLQKKVPDFSEKIIIFPRELLYI